MKLTFILLTAAFLQVNAAGIAQTVSINARELPLKDLITQLHQITGFDFICSSEIFNDPKPISISVKDAPLEDVLNQSLSGHALKFIINKDEKTVSLSRVLKDNKPDAPAIVIKGKITDNKGAPLQGVTVSVKDKNISVSSDPGGLYSISIPDNNPNAILIFKFIGFHTQEIPVKDKRTINVTLEEETNTLTDVVVIGYGTQSKRNVTGAVASFNAKSLNERPVTRIDEAMIGQMPGVQVRQQTSLPGQGLSIQVRGAGSITAGNEPLYVLDGFPLDVSAQNSAGGYSNGNPLDNINPNDIESIQVLKDAAAAAIYGSRAANGVVLITTKKGQIGQSRVNFNAYSGVSQVRRKQDVLSPDEWIAQATEIINEKWVASGTGRTADQTTDQRRQILNLAPGQYNTNLMYDQRWVTPGHPGLTYVDWQDEAFRSAPFQNYEISASGGSASAKYFLSGNYANQDGVVLGNNFKSYSARANIELTASNKLKFSINIAPSYSENNQPGLEGKDNILMKLYNLAPIVEDTAGVYTNSGKNDIYQWASSSNSPIAQLQQSIALTKKSRTITSFSGQYNILDNFYIKSTVNYDELNASSKSYTPDAVSGKLSARINTPGISASGSYSGYRRQYFVNENTLNYSKSIGKHNFSALAGMSYNFSHIDLNKLRATGGYANDIINTLNGAVDISGTSNNNTTESQNVLLSYFGRVQYDFMGRYLLSASIRRDGSSRFGANNFWGVFPSASLGWRISDENFMKEITFINDLKLRGSWGKSGNNSISDYGGTATLGAYNYQFGGNSPVLSPGQAPNKVSNPDLSWEKSETFDVGLDASMLKNRIALTFDYYTKNNTALLLNIPVPGASGFTSALQNIGSVMNKGWEFGINTTNITGRNFQWNTTINISHNSNKVVHLGTDDAAIPIASGYGSDPYVILQVGQPMYSYYVIQRIGILTQQDIDNHAALYGTETVGDPKYQDVNGDGVINGSDRKLSGHPNPDYIWNINNTFRYKAFDLNVQIYGQRGGAIYSLLGRALDNPSQGRNTTLGVYRDRWTKENQNYNAPRAKINETYGYVYNTDWLYSSDFWRVQNITLGYNIKSVIRSQAIQAARVYLTFQNFFGHDKYIGGANPEAQNTNISGDGSFAVPGDYGGMPLTKTVIFGVNFTF